MRGIILAAAVVPAVTAAVLKAGHWQMHADRHHITVTPGPIAAAPRVMAWAASGSAERFRRWRRMAAWSDRRHLRIPLRRGPAADPRPDEPAF